MRRPEAIPRLGTFGNRSDECEDTIWIKSKLTGTECCAIVFTVNHAKTADLL